MSYNRETCTEWILSEQGAQQGVEYHKCTEKGKLADIWMICSKIAYLLLVCQARTKINLTTR